MITRSPVLARISALFSVFVWGTTFISTKTLLNGFTPTEILFIRFLSGYVVLLLIYPKRLDNKNKKNELYFAGAGLTGLCLYYLCENTALTYTLASNVGVIVAIAPFFTSVLAKVIKLNDEKFGINFYIGFAFAIVGIFLINFNGTRLELNPRGDFLAFLAAMLWAFYSIFTRKISSLGYNVILTTRRIFFYGIIFMIPFLFLSDFSLKPELLKRPEYMINFIYLSMFASALCFVTWNYSVNVLGAVKSSIYIYLIPVITVISSFLVLKEPVTPLLIIGTALTFLGLIVSELKRNG